MSYYFILTGSFFINWLSDSEYEIPKCAKKLLTELNQISSINKEIEVKVVGITDKILEEAYAEQIWVYRYIRAHYEIEKCNGGDEITSVKELAKLKSQIYDKVIIVNGSNIYSEDSEIQKAGNIETLNEVKSLNFVKTNLNF